MIEPLSARALPHPRGERDGEAARLALRDARGPVRPAVHRGANRVDDALATARALADRGIGCTLNQLGEAVTAKLTGRPTISPG